MKPIVPSVPLTRPSLVPPSAEHSPPIARPPLQPHPQPGHWLGKRACALPKYSKLRWLTSGSTSVFQRFFFPHYPSRNVAEAFDNVMRRLDELYHSRDADAPRDFERRLHFWRDVCGLPAEAHSHSCKHSVCGAMRASTATLGSGSERGHLARRRPRSTWPRFGAPSTACAHGRSGPDWVRGR